MDENVLEVMYTRAQRCRVHIWRIIVVRDVAVVTSTTLAMTLSLTATMEPMMATAVVKFSFKTFSVYGRQGERKSWDKWKDQAEREA
jgi:hypothetical protein